MAMKRCPDCGEKYSDSYKYCPFCEEEEILKEGKGRGSRRARQSTGEPEHTYSAPVQTIQPGEGITLPLAAALAWLLR